MTAKWELYNIAADRSELVDLSGTHPERVAKLSTLWQTYAKRTQVIPWPENKKKKPAKAKGSK